MLLLYTHKTWHEPSSTSFFLGNRCSYTRLVPNFLELVYKIWHEPSPTSLLISAVSKSSGMTALQCSLAGSFTARIFDMFHELALKIWPEPSSKYLAFLGTCCSHIRLVPNVLELAYQIWPKVLSASLLLSVICKDSGETARMCCLA